jgi:hypothetical protein
MFPVRTTISRRTRCNHRDGDSHDEEAVPRNGLAAWAEIERRGYESLVRKRGASP